jgi:hypothetical protein
VGVCLSSTSVGGVRRSHVGGGHILTSVGWAYFDHATRLVRGTFAYARLLFGRLTWRQSNTHARTVHERLLGPARDASSLRVTCDLLLLLLLSFRFVVGRERKRDVTCDAWHTVWPAVRRAACHAMQHLCIGVRLASSVGLFRVYTPLLRCANRSMRRASSLASARTHLT